jgi:hypothetical protein
VVAELGAEAVLAELGAEVVIAELKPVGKKYSSQNCDS